MEKIISVIIPVYNAEQYLEECLLSVIGQTIFDKIEVVAIDDGSTDSSFRILNDFADKFENIKVIKQKNQGIAKTRQVGYYNSTGKYIAMLDNDDFVEADMYERLLNTAERNNADYVYCDYSFYPKAVSQKAKWFKKYTGELTWNVIERNTQPWNKLIRRDLAESIDMGRLLLIYSDSIYVDLLIHAKKIVCMDDELYHYRVGHASVSGSYVGKLDYYEEISKRAEKQQFFLDQESLKEKFDVYFEYRYIYTLIQLCCVAALNNSKNVYKRAVNNLKKMDYMKNPYTKLVMKEDYGKLKAFILVKIIPHNFWVAKQICKIAFA